MKKYLTADGYEVYRIKKEKKYVYLADVDCYAKEIKKLADTMDDLKFDSQIFLFGIDTGAYLPELRKLICRQNSVVIFEPNQAICKKYPVQIDENIRIVYFQKQEVKAILERTINFQNLNNIYFYAFGNYAGIYQAEYKYLIEQLDWTLFNATGHISLANRFRKVFVQNMIANIKQLNTSTPIEKYRLLNLDIPALIVSGGPSLDRNIRDLCRFREELHKYFIIAGSRTVAALQKNDIMPDLIVSIDPVDANYDMMKEYLDLKVPLAFYEYSNRYLLKMYQGDKIYIPLLFPHTRKEFRSLRGVYSGGSVAHTCIDIANMMGCSPIIMLGQDLAFTTNKHHADCASFAYDKTLKYQPQLCVKDIYGKPVNTTMSLLNYKKTLEHYIEVYRDSKRVSFINCSYGAQIKGAPHQSLQEILMTNRLMRHQERKKCIPDRCISISEEEVVKDILDFVDEFHEKAEQGMELCETLIQENHKKSLLEMEEEDMDLQRMLFVLNIVDEFENHPDSHYLGGYFTLFISRMKEKVFCMSALEYENLTADLQYQVRSFRTYFRDMRGMLEEVKKMVLDTVQDFYE